ncbi:MAG: hypothetical protein HOK18_08115, partial [Porticoccaceae bacterium]|nr:hypothetical protein [Porticoccaceae bacterium]
IAREVTVVPASLPDKEELSAAEQLFAKKSGDEEPNEQLMQQSNIVQPACVAMGLTGEIT